MRRVYIAGPMSGYPWFNFPEFFGVEKVFRELGWLTINPARIDLEEWAKDPSRAPSTAQFAGGIFAPPSSETTWDEEERYMEVIDRDLRMIQTLRKYRGDAIALLDGWQKSRGANAEAALGIWKGITVMPWRRLIDEQAAGGREGAEADPSRDGGAGLLPGRPGGGGEGELGRERAAQPGPAVALGEGEVDRRGRRVGSASARETQEVDDGGWEKGSCASTGCLEGIGSPAERDRR